MAVATKTPECSQPLIVESQNAHLWVPLGVNSPVINDGVSGQVGADLLICPKT